MLDYKRRCAMRVSDALFHVSSADSEGVPEAGKSNSVVDQCFAMEARD